MSVKYSENLGLPFFVRPRPQCCKKQNRMKWNIKNMEKGKSLLFRIVFSAGKDVNVNAGRNILKYFIWNINLDVDTKHLLKQMSDDVLIKGHFHSEPGIINTNIL